MKYFLYHNFREVLDILNHSSYVRLVYAHDNFRRTNFNSIESNDLRFGTYCYFIITYYVKTCTVTSHLVPPTQITIVVNKHNLAKKVCVLVGSPERFYLFH